jgi:hypothetical protein
MYESLASQMGGTVNRRTRVLVVALMLSAVFLLSGCIDIIYQVQVEDDGSGGVRVIAAYDPKKLETLLQSSEEQTSTTLVTDDLRLKAASSGLQVDEIAAGDQSGVRVTGSFASPEEFPQTLDRIEQLFLSMDVAEALTSLGVAPSLDGTLTADKGPFKTSYSLSLGSGESVEDTMLAAFQEMMPTRVDYAAVARMPGKTVTTNGRYQPSDQSLVWPSDATTKTAEDFTAVSQVVNWKSIALAGGGVALVLVAVVVLLVFLRRKKRDSSARSNSPAARPKPKGTRR